MSHPDVSNLRRAISEFDACVRGVGGVATEQDLRADVDSANAIFSAISDADTAWHSEVVGGTLGFEEAGLERIAELYREWAETGRALLATLNVANEEAQRGAGLALLRSNLDEVRGMLTPVADFFDDGRLVPRQEEAIESLRRGETVEFEEMGH